MLAAEWCTKRRVENCGISRSADQGRPGLPSRAALSRAKASPAWCEDRVSGDDATIKNPFA
jgi:hypothetical protein